MSTSDSSLCPRCGGALVRVHGFGTTACVACLRANAVKPVESTDPTEAAVEQARADFYAYKIGVDRIGNTVVCAGEGHEHCQVNGFCSVAYTKETYR